jgi:hypothetical protein
LGKFVSAVVEGAEARRLPRRLSYRALSDRTRRADPAGDGLGLPLAFMPVLR